MHSLRRLAQSPGYAAIALVTLALGIGVNTSMFSVVDALLFRNAPFPKVDRIVQLTATTQSGDLRIFSATELNEIRGQASAFATLTTLGSQYFAVSEPGRPAERIFGTVASRDLFATFGMQPLVGRAFTPEEYQPGRNQVIVLSYAFWQERFGGMADAVGRTLRLDGENVTIVGVMPPAFDYTPLWGGCAFWRPLNFTPDQIQWRDYRAFTLVGRLNPGATLAQAAAELAPLAALQAKAHPESYSGLRYRALPLHEALMDNTSRRISWMLFGLSGFVLLIACANLANLQLARATANARELAIRSALGASRPRLIAEQLAEPLILAIGGGGIALAVAFALNRLLEQNLALPGGVDIALDLDGRVLTLTMLVSVFTGLLFGLVPAWLASRTDVNAALKQQARGSTAGRGHHRLRQTLVVAEVALALVLLGGAAVLQRGLEHVLERRSGWDTERILTGVLPVPESRIQTDAQRIVLFRKIEDRLAALPGVEHAALATSLPITSYSGDRQVLVEGQTPGDAARLPSAFHVMVTSDYFATMGIPLLEGRLFAPGIKPTDPRIIVINEALARRLWPGRSAIGQRLGSMDSGKAYWAEVVGVVRDVDTAAGVGNPSTLFQVYKPLVHEPWSFVHVVLRSPAPGSLTEALRRAIAAVDPDLALDRIGTVRQIAGEQQRTFTLAAKALAGFALLGLILAAVGLFGVISNLVAQRTGEFGIRLALGARPRDVVALVLAHGLRLTAIGLALGLAGACALGRLLGSMMPRISTLDPVALIGTAALLFVVALLACWLPARRATKVDPMIALRAE